MKNNMNRRKFITTTALALPSVAVFGAISTQPKTYRSLTSLFSNEEMTEWCNKNGLYYAKDDELNKQFFKHQINDDLVFMDKHLFDRDKSLSYINGNEPLFWNKGYKRVVIDIFTTDDKEIYFWPQNSVVISCVFGEKYV
jgi:hypothetical protein